LNWPSTTTFLPQTFNSSDSSTPFPFSATHTNCVRQLWLLEVTDATYMRRWCHSQPERAVRAAGVPRCCDATGFYLTLITGQTRWLGSNHDQPGPSPCKSHQHSPISILNKSNALPMVKTLAKRDKPFDVFVWSRNFGHVLQILPKHLIIYQHKSCAESPGTHFIYRVALLVLSGKGAKLPSKLRVTVHREMRILQIGIRISPSIWVQFKNGFSHYLE
jgi:hypothetical protein